MRTGIVVEVSAAVRPAGGDRGGPQQPAEACLARADRAVVCRWLRHHRDHAAQPAPARLRLALAGTLHGRGVAGLLRDKTRPSRITPLGRVAGASSPLTLDRSAWRDHPLDGPRDGQRAASASVRCSASGARTVCSRTGRQFKLSNDPRSPTSCIECRPLCRSASARRRSVDR